MVQRERVYFLEMRLYVKQSMECWRAIHIQVETVFSACGFIWCRKSTLKCYGVVLVHWRAKVLCKMVIYLYS